MSKGIRIEALKVGAPVEVTAAELAALLAGCETVREVRPVLAGPIRILRRGAAVALQEESPRGELFLRRLGALAEAEAILEDRLATYERMWDGCGCKVHYRE